MRPQPPRGPELRHLLEEVVVRVEEEREPLAERVRLETGRDRRLAVGDPVRDREPELLHRGRSGLADVVPGDRDRVPARDPLGAVGEQVGRQAHRGPRREDVVPAGDVLLEDVVLHRPAQRGAVDTLALGHELVEQQEQRRGRIDRHRRRDLVERDPVEQQLHVGERVDCDPGAADLALGTRIVRVEPELGRQVERDREPRLPLLEQVAVARVRLLGRREAGVLPDRPGPSAVHVAVDPAREGRLPGQLQVARGVRRRVDRLELDSRLGQALVGRSHRRVGYLPCM